MVVNDKLAGGRSDGAEYRIECNRVARKVQFVVRSGRYVVVGTTHPYEAACKRNQQ